MTAQAMTNGVLGWRRIVGKLRSNTKWPVHMIAYEVTNKASDQDGRQGTSKTAAAMMGQPTQTWRMWLTGSLWSSWYFATSRSKRLAPGETDAEAVGVAEALIVDFPCGLLLAG